ncbi:MAG: TrkA family potassium uptake protein [Fimbriimonadaceae bacterium]|nr:TrkA family potassium uptake protein [Fimbriimonadaceae bacterium]
MNAVIFGCGRTGAALALQLRAAKYSVTIIEQNPEALIRLGNDHGCEIIIGSGLDNEVLQRANLANAEAFFALTRGDNTNLMAAQIVRLKYNCPRVCVKVSDPLRADAYRKMGYVCINPPSLAAGMMLDWVLEREYKPVDAYNDLPEELKV